MIRQLRKNRGRKGASLLIAILVFFLAALSGTVALTMAQSNAGRYTHEKEDQQAYLAVASASKLILDELGKVRVHFDGTSTGVPQNTSDVGDPIYYKNDSTGTNEQITNPCLFLCDSRFKKQLKEILPYGKQVEGTAEIADPEGYQPVSFKLTVEGNEKSSVLVEFDLHEETKLFIRLWYAENGNQSYQMTVSVNLGEGAQWETDKTEGAGGAEGAENAKYYVNLTWKTDEPTYTFEREYSTKTPEAGEGVTI